MNNESISHLSDLASSNDWSTIVPELALAVFALLLMALDLAVPSARRQLPKIAIGLQLVVIGLTVWLHSLGGGTDGTIFAGMLYQGEWTFISRIFFLICGVLVSHLGMVYLARKSLAKVEFFHLVMLVTAGFMLLVQSSHFVMQFVALEALTIGFYVLVAYARNSAFSLEAGLKYLIMGGLSSGIMLFGIALLFGAGSNPELGWSSNDPLHFFKLQAFIDSNSDNLLVLAGAGLVIAGLAFKIGLVPFQIWIPDVYQGAPTPVTAFLAVASKGAGIMVLITLLHGPFAALSGFTLPLLSVMCAATILFGNLAALPQRNVKRLMGLSGVSHAGILLLGVIASLSISWVIPVIFFYLFVYAFASFAVFEVMAHVGENDADQEIDYYSELMQKNPSLGAGLVIGVGSLAGIPPLAGFITKVLIFFAALKAGLYWLLGLAVLGVVLSIYYYFGWLRASVTKGLFLDEKCPDPRPPLLGSRIVLYGLSALTLILGLYQGMIQFS